ncbi:MAG: outer membrane lipoprotein-sorting protein [Methylococcales bacterium]|jgi:outer membrane lipoprotein-sorting protein|nr:outer membrane lipoprotein-sorting protein [Methylococcales bacterium]
MKQHNMLNILTLVLSISYHGLAHANTDQAYTIAAQSDRSDRGFTDSKVKFTMTLRNSQGDESLRQVEIRTMEVANEDSGDKSLVIFKTPRDISGTALLSHANILDPDHQWLYLPALKRVKRISSANKSGPFVGSEFSYEDLTAQELNKYRYEFVTTEPCGNDTCDVLLRFPKYEYSGYSKQKVWIDQRIHQVRKTEFFDRKGDLLKTLVQDQYKQYSNAYWRSHRFEMTNHQSGKSTTLAYSDYQFKTGLVNKDFKKHVLKRVR